MTMIAVEVLAVKPHPCQATHNPGDWAVQFRVVHADQSHTFWRWHTVRKLNENGAYCTPDPIAPSSAEILARFWSDTFMELHGFDFDRMEEDA